MVEVLNLLFGGLLAAAMIAGATVVGGFSH